MSSSIDQNVYQIHPHIMYYQQHQQQMNNAALLQQQLLHQQYHDVSSNFLSVTKLDWFYTNQPYGPLFRKIFVLPYPRRSLFGYFCETNQMARHHCDKKYVALVSCHNNATIFFDVVDLIHDIFWCGRLDPRYIFDCWADLRSSPLDHRSRWSESFYQPVVSEVFGFIDQMVTHES